MLFLFQKICVDKDEFLGLQESESEELDSFFEESVDEIEGFDLLEDIVGVIDLDEDNYFLLEFVECLICCL